MTQVFNQKVKTRHSVVAYLDPADLNYSVEEMIALLVQSGESPREAKRQVIVARSKTEQKPTRVVHVDGQKIEFEVNY